MIDAKYYSASDTDKALTFDGVVNQILDFIKDLPENQYKLIIGTDSLYRAHGTVFATVIVIHRVGKGARFWWTRTKEKFEMNLYTRIMREAQDSVELMQAIYDSEIVMYVNEEDFAVHIDAGMDGDSRRVVNDCVGYVTGLGFHCEVKPDSVVAVTVADRITK
mgnify:CR=1 FL=1